MKSPDLIYDDAFNELRRNGETVRYIRLLRNAARAGYARAMVDLGQALMDGVCNKGKVLVRRSPKLAVGYFRRASELGDSMALLSYGNCLSEGIGVHVDIKKAVCCYIKSSRLGEYFAAFNLSTIYRDCGDRRREIYWLRKARDLGDPTAALVLAEMHLAARGERGRVARRYIERMLKSSDDVIRDEASEILIHFDKFGYRRWAPGRERAMVESRARLVTRRVS